MLRPDLLLLRFAIKGRHYVETILGMPVRFWHWCSTWNWYDLLFLGGFVVSLAIHEYALSVAFLILCAIGALSQVAHKDSLPGTPKVFAGVGIVLALVFLSFVSVQEKGKQEWSWLDSPTRGLFGRRQTIADSWPLPTYPPDYRKLEPIKSSAEADKKVQSGEAASHHPGEGFIQITEVASDPAKVIAIGSPVSFNIIARNTGQERVDNGYMFNSFIPVGELSPDFPSLSDSQIKNKFEDMRKKAIEQQRKSGDKGETLGPGESRIQVVGTRSQVLTQRMSESFYAKNTKFYVLSWAEWKTLNGITATAENCVWLEPPNPPTPNPDKLWWNECDEP